MECEYLLQIQPAGNGPDILHTHHTSPFEAFNAGLLAAGAGLSSLGYVALAAARAWY